MKKTIVLLMMLCGAIIAHAQNYGVLVNGKMYFAADWNGPDGAGEGFEEYLAHVSVQAGDYCQLYDADNKAAWAVDVNSYSKPGFTRNGDKYEVSVTGCYDFYIKLKWQEDELYIGPGSNCGSGVDITKEDPTPSYAGSSPARCPDVILQAFYWDSYTDKGYGRTKWIDHLNGANGSDAVEMGKWFDLIWLPPMTKATGGTGYIPSDYSDLNSDWGTDKRLRELINTFHQNGARMVADIVINHGAAWSGWCGWTKTYDFGTYGQFTPSNSWICKTDEMNFNDDAGDCKGKATGAKDDGYGDEANYDGARDWDHTNAQVQNMFKAYLQWLRYEVHVDGFRYDYCKGFNNSHINDYNRAARPYFSVMEMWDGNTDVLQEHLNDARYNTLTFDFALKYQAFNNGIASDNYAALKDAGLAGVGKSRYAVTFLDSHDSFQRDGNEFCGLGNSMTTCKDKIMQCYAYLLSMPGVPLVFWPHWVEFKDELKPLINARYKTGVHSQSAVSAEADEDYYKATITGSNGEIRVLIGPKSGYATAPTGYTLAGKGVNYGVYYKVTSARGDKDKNRQPIVPDVPQAIDEVKDNGSQVIGEKFLQDGRLYIRCGEQVFDAMGREVKGEK